MAKITFIRAYPFVKSVMVDILYESNRIYTMPIGQMPRTAKEWMVDKTATEVWDKMLERWETIYK